MRAAICHPPARIPGHVSRVDRSSVRAALRNLNTASVPRAATTCDLTNGKEDRALDSLHLRPCGAVAAPSQQSQAPNRGDLRFWRPRYDTHWALRLLGFSRLAFLPVIAVAIFFTWQSFIARVQYFDVVSTSHSPPTIGATIVGFVRHALGLPPPTTYDLEQEMSAGELIGRWEPLIRTASQHFGVPEGWVRTVMQMESGGRTMSADNRPIVSRAGAMGLMQLMPGTYAELRAQYGFGANPFDPRDNVFAGAAYLRWLHARYGYPALFAAYNDGPGHFEARLSSGAKLPLETRNYVSRIAATLGGGSGISGVGVGAAQVRLVSFTRPNGTRVAINMNAIASVRAALPGEYAPAVRTVITVGNERQGVKENIATVGAALRAHGAHTHVQLADAQAHRPTELSNKRRISVSYSMQARHCHGSCSRSDT